MKRLLLLLGLLLVASPAFATISQTCKAGAVSNAVTLGCTPSVGDLIVVPTQPSADVTGVTDNCASGGNTYTKSKDADYSGKAIFSELWFTVVTQSCTPTITVANGFGGSFVHVEAAVYASTNGSWSSPDDATAAATAVGDLTPADSGSGGTTAQASELIVGSIANIGPNNLTWDASVHGPLVEEYDDNTGGAGRAGSWASYIASATDTFQAKAAMGGNANWAAVVAAYKEPAGGTTAILRRTLTGVGQ